MYKSIVFLVSVVIALVSAGPPDMGQMKEYVDKCAVKFPKVDLKFLDNLPKSNFETTDGDVKCFLKCIGESCGKVSADGKLIADKIKQKPLPNMDTTKLDAALTKCTAVVGADPCDTTYQQHICLMKEVMPPM